MKVRFAPSPTGYMHVGNCRTLLANWLLARKNKGTFILRIDDTDTTRTKKIYEDALFEDLKWLGLSYDALYRQSDRLARYDEVVQFLKESGRLYPCYETAEELDFKRKNQLSRHLPPLYDRAALSLSAQQKEAFEKQGRKPHWRFLLTPETIEWHDLIKGPVHIQSTSLSDPVLLREDGCPLYTLASVVDDMDMGITHILRGEDHLTNTAVQRQIWQALGHPSDRIQFGHLSLLSNSDGSELSKRLGSTSIRDFKDQGFLPMSINSILSKIGTSDPIAPFNYLDDLVNSYDLAKFSTGNPKFSIEDLKILNEKILHHTSFEEILAFTQTPLTPAMWDLIRENTGNLTEIPFWYSVLTGDANTFCAETNKSFIHQALQSLPSDPFSNAALKSWLDSLKKDSGRKGAELFMPLRQALTGLDHGPHLLSMIHFMGFDLCQKRLRDSLILTSL